MPQVAPQFAPGGDHTHTVEKSQRERPDDPLRFLTLRVPVLNLDLSLRPDSAADLRQLGVTSGKWCTGPDQQRRTVEFMAQIGGQHRANLGEQIARSGGQFGVRSIGYPARAEHQRLDLYFRK